ncbi:MAG: response regulator [Defluviitaleaceae bacterium]|nr:response regulator [Defluviitaleaceae bacterium]
MSIQILIAEDEPIIRSGIRKMTEEFFGDNCSIMESLDGRDAYRKCISNAPDILITDIKMPGISGVALIKALSKEKICPNILVISGHQDYKYVREAMKYGAYDYLLKPIKKDKMWEALSYFAGSSTIIRPEGLSTLYPEQCVIERLFLMKSEYHDIYEHFVETVKITDKMPCDVFFLVNDLQDKNSSFELYHEIQQFCSAHEDVLSIQGEIKTWVVMLIYKNNRDANIPTRLKDYLASKGHQLLSQHNLASIDRAYNLTSHFKDAFYDLHETDTLPAEAKIIVEEISNLVLGGEDVDSLVTVINNLFDRYRIDRAEPEQIRIDMIGLVYQMMAKNGDMIEFISKARLLSHDLAENLAYGHSLSGLRSIVVRDLIYLHSQVRERKIASEDTTIKTSVAYIQKHFAENIELADAAHVVHLHPNYFSSLFRQYKM